MKIKKITEITPQIVYAVQTSTHTFISDNLAHHNCVRCNMYLSGNEAIYGVKMVEKYGLKKVKELLKLKDQVKRWKRQELLDIISKYEKRKTN